MQIPTLRNVRMTVVSNEAHRYRYHFTAIVACDMYTYHTYVIQYT